MTDNPYAYAADTYWTVGWRGILPLPAGAKKHPPKGYTGEGGRFPSYADIHTWADGKEGAGNIALRMPAHIIGIDVDNYGGKPGAQTLTDAEAAHGELPPTWRTTSRDDGVSGIRFYRIPEGLAWPGEIGPAIELIRVDHRYAVVWPSLHPEGRTYRWISPDGLVSTTVPDPDELPNLPRAWVDAYTGGQLASSTPRATVGDREAIAWIVGRPHAGGAMCSRMERALEQHRDDLPGSAHNATRDAVLRVARLADEGHHGATQALGEVRGVFMAETTRQGRPSGRRSQSEAAHEFSDLVTSAVGVVVASPSGMATCDCFGQLTGLIAPATPPKAPEPVVDGTAALAPQERPETAPEADDEEGPAAELTWRPVDLGIYLSGEYVPEEPTLFPRVDGICLLYPGRVHSFHGESESGKSLVAQYEAARLIGVGEDVLYIDFESDAAAVVARLLDLGASSADIAGRFTYLRPGNDPRKFPEEREEFIKVTAKPYAMAVIDGMTDALGIFGAGTQDNDEIAAFMRAFPRLVATRTLAAVVLIDHVTKDADTRGRFALGGQAKMNALDGAAYVVEVEEALGRGLCGRVVLRVAKDRPGSVRPHAGAFRHRDRTQEAARLTIDSTGGDGRIRVTVDSYSEALSPEQLETKRADEMCERVSVELEGLRVAYPLGVSKGTVSKLVTGNNEAIAEAVDRLLEGGYVANLGTSSKFLLVSEKPFRKDVAWVDSASSPSSPLLSSLPRERSALSSPPLPPPYKGGREESGLRRVEDTPENDAALPEVSLGMDVSCSDCFRPTPEVIAKVWGGRCGKCAHEAGLC